MKLHLLRHAKTDQQSSTGRDFDRKLLPKGIVQGASLARYFTDTIVVNTVWCSEAARTRETLSIIQKSNEFENVSYCQELYLCSRDVFLQKIWSLKHSDDLLIVGHNFGISDLATYLTDVHVELKTGGYICIEFQADSWEETSRGMGEITAQFRPKVSL
ncbi:MAG: histidine phosphatase family protein [Crocinitomicaceae bacterium]|nr:histidine phosphatase family protein [Crocinitomicaceae bacterium]